MPFVVDRGKPWMVPYLTAVDLCNYQMKVGLKIMTVLIGEQIGGGQWYGCFTWMWPCHLTRADSELTSHY